MNASEPSKRVVILGAGFGGLACCKKLRKKDLSITVVDRQNHHLFQPLLYQVATAGLSAPDIAQPVRAILARQHNTTVLMQEVTGIDLTARKVLTGEREIPYDYLVIALGVRSGYFGHPHWARFAPGLKSLSDATRLRADLLYCFERAESASDPVEIARLMTIVIIGGGPTGVEIAGACAELARKVLKQSFRHIDTARARIILLEAAPRILGTFSEDLSRYAERKLARKGVAVRTNTPVADISEHRVHLEGEIIEADTIVWSAGVEAPPLTRSLGVKLDRTGRIVVDKDLSVPGHPEVFAIGDIASAVDTGGETVPGLAPAAIQMGRHVASIIAQEAFVPGGDLKPYQGLFRKEFSYLDKGTMATIGRSAAVASTMGLRFRGFIAWILWLFIHLILLVGLRNKLVVLLQWFYAYLRYNPGARIITGVTGGANDPKSSGLSR